MYFSSRKKTRQCFIKKNKNFNTFRFMGKPILPKTRSSKTKDQETTVKTRNSSFFYVTAEVNLRDCG